MTVLWTVLGVLAALFIVCAVFTFGVVVGAMASSRRYHDLQAQHEELQSEFDQLIDDMMGMEKLDQGKAAQARGSEPPPG